MAAKGVHMVLKFELSIKRDSDNSLGKQMAAAILRTISIERLPGGELYTGPKRANPKVQTEEPMPPENQLVKKTLSALHTCLLSIEEALQTLPLREQSEPRP